MDILSKQNTMNEGTVKAGSSYRSECISHGPSPQEVWIFVPYFSQLSETLAFWVLGPTLSHILS